MGSEMCIRDRLYIDRFNVTSDQRDEIYFIKGLNLAVPTGINEQNCMKFVVILKE